MLELQTGSDDERQWVAWWIHGRTADVFFLPHSDWFLPFSALCLFFPVRLLHSLKYKNPIQLVSHLHTSLGTSSVQRVYLFLYQKTSDREKELVVGSNWAGNSAYVRKRGGWSGKLDIFSDIYFTLNVINWGSMTILVGFSFGTKHREMALHCSPVRTLSPAH